MPADAHPLLKYCCDECKAEERETAKPVARPRYTAAPGCEPQCGSCRDCKITLALQASSDDFEARGARGES